MIILYLNLVAPCKDMASNRSMTCLKMGVFRTIFDWVLLIDFRTDPQRLFQPVKSKQLFDCLITAKMVSRFCPLTVF